MTLAADLAAMAAGPGRWRIVGPDRPGAGLGPVAEAVDRAGVRAVVFRPAAADPEALARTLGALDPAGVAVACLPGWRDCPTLAAVLEAAATLDLPSVFLDPCNEGPSPCAASASRF